MRQGTTKNAAGVGGRIEELPCMGSMATITGGSEIQRRGLRDYSKVAHENDRKEREALPDAIQPSENVSGPYRVF